MLSLALGLVLLTGVAMWPRQPAAATPNENFVYSVYMDFLLRHPSDAESLWWTSALAGSTTRTTMVRSVLQDDEFQEMWVGLVNELYLGGVDYDDPGLTTQFTNLQASNDYRAVEVAVLGGADYYAAVGSTANGFVVNLYNDVMRRAPSPSEQSYWAGELTSGTRSRAWMANHFIRTSEAAGHRIGSATVPSCTSTGFTTSADLDAGSYCLILDRVADAPGRTYWIGQLTGTAQLPTLWASFAGSAEYFNNAQ